MLAGIKQIDQGERVPEGRRVEVLHEPCTGPGAELLGSCAQLPSARASGSAWDLSRGLGRAELLLGLGPSGGVQLREGVGWLPEAGLLPLRPNSCMYSPGSRKAPSMSRDLPSLMH